MATCSSFSPVSFFDTCKDAFYFQVALETDDADVDEDSFGNSGRCLSRWVRSKENKFLLLNSEEQFQAKNLSSTQLNQPDCKFQFQMYRDLDKAGRVGNPTMLYVKNGEGQNVVACCDRNRNIYSENMGALPEKIEDTHHKALFYMTELSPCNMFQFESSVFPSEFLGFAANGDNPSLEKLVLRKKCEDEVDESCQVLLLCH